MMITAAGPNVKNVFYEIDDTQKFEYKVNFYIKDSTTPVPGLAALEGEAPVGEESSSVDDVYYERRAEPVIRPGYKPGQPTNMMITCGRTECEECF
ncbi:hypothetical protein F220043C3_11660 [Enterocloster asparagiformis]|uniref:hypothetical protein n=1 Tax=Enterocloster asparagiformis TaxID=333367 RepID=UPI0034A7F15D